MENLNNKQFLSQFPSQVDSEIPYFAECTRDNWEENPWPQYSGFNGDEEILIKQELNENNNQYNENFSFGDFNQTHIMNFEVQQEVHSSTSSIASPHSSEAISDSSVSSPLSDQAQQILPFNNTTTNTIQNVTNVVSPVKRKASDDSATQTKAKRKVESGYIQDNRKRSMCLTKRKKSLMNKASEISELTGAEVLLVIAINNRVYRHYCNPQNLNSIIPNLQSTLSQSSSNEPVKFETGQIQYQHFPNAPTLPHFQQKSSAINQLENQKL